MMLSNGGKTPAKEIKESSLKAFLTKLRKRHIIETLAAFVGGGWLLIEVVERLLVSHYRFPDKTIDITVVSIIGALLCVLIWRWFSGTEKRPGNVKIEILIIPLIILIALAIDLNLIFKMARIPDKRLVIGIIAFLLGIAWVIFKLSQWAAGLPEARKKEVLIFPTAQARPEKSIIVLPFTDLSPEKDQEYFCDGMTEEIITDLSCCQELLVISRSSAMTLKGSPKTVKEIAKELNVRYALEGSVRKAGNDLRITAQLIDADTDVHLWADKYSGTINDIFDIQEKVSSSIVNALKLKLTPEEKRKIAEQPIENIAAYDYYLKAIAEILACTEDSIHRAILFLQNALEIMGDNALLNSAMGFAYWNLVNIGAEQEDGLEKAESCIQKALAINPESPQAHAVFGWLIFLDPRANPFDSRLHFKKALAVSPENVLALQGLTNLYISLPGKISEAAPLCQKLLQIAPLDVPTRWFQGGLYFYGGQYDQALQGWTKLYEIYPDHPMAQFSFAIGLAYTGKIDQMLLIIDGMARSNPDAFVTKLCLMLKYGILKDKERAIQLMTPDFQKTCLRDCTYSHHLAGVFSQFDEKKEALDWLENAINRGFINYPMLAEKDPWLTNIRSEPRFKKLMKRVKYEWEHFEV